MDTETAKRTYLENEIWILTFGGAFQRGSVYDADAKDAAKDEFREAIKQRVGDIVQSKYAKGRVSSADHTQEIADLAEWVSRHHGALLANGRFRTGVAQKLLNLYLKYLWCWDKIPEPPHCPFDRTIMEKLGSAQDVKWTDMDDIAEYESLVRSAEELSGDQLSLAQWELREFNRQVVKS